MKPSRTVSFAVYLAVACALSCLAYSIISLFAFAKLANAPDFSRRTSMSGMVPAVVYSAHLVSQVDPNKEMTTTVGLKLRNTDELEKLLIAQSDPSSLEYRHYLTPDEFTRRFCPTQEDYDQVIAFAKSQNLTVIEVVPNRLIVTVHGTVSQIEKAFGVKLNYYRYREHDYISNDGQPKLPSCLAGVVQSVMGLNTFANFHAMHQQAAHVSQKDDNEPFGFSPAQIATAYDFPNSNNKAARNVYTGKGVTVAIATAENYDLADVQSFWNKFGITRTGQLVNIPIDTLSTKHNDETTLDLEQASSQAPGADVLMYLSPDFEDSSFARVFNRIVTDTRADGRCRSDIISFSWGASEGELEQASIDTYHNILMQASAQGVAVFCASGDNGAYDFHDKNNKDVLSVDYPSADPNVTAVGGTHLTLNADAHRIAERAWSGSGGGISSKFARPVWQSDAGLPAGNMRGSADVALFSDPWFGYAFYYNGQWQALSGGTSFAAPNWAAFWALVDEACGERVGGVNAAVYRIGRSADYSKLFFDVVDGSNGGGRGAGYKCSPGWDYPTGWGAPRASDLLDWFKQQTKDKSSH